MTHPPDHSRSVRLRADLTLLLVAMIWGSAFVAQRVAAQNMGAYLFNGVRFILGGLLLAPLALLQRSRPSPLKHWPSVTLAGVLLFAGASTQQLGLRYTTAGNAGFITGLYVVMIPIVQAVFLRHRPRRVIWLASLAAAAGMFLLSTGGQFRLALGDALELVCAMIWSLHVLWIARMVQRMDVLHLVIGQNLVCGLLSLGVAFTLEGSQLSQALAGWWPILYTGVFSIAVAYTLQALGQRVAPPADAAIIMSLEAVFAALGGWLLLDERLAPVQLTGAALMFSGMLIAQVPNAPAAEGADGRPAHSP